MPSNVLDLVLAQYGLTLVLIGWFVYREVWPIARSYFSPEYAAKRRQELAKERADTRQAMYDREDRLFRAFEGNTTALVSLQVTLGAIAKEVAELSQSVQQINHDANARQQRINEDLAGIYGLFRQQRPSRKHVEKQPEKHSDAP